MNVEYVYIDGKVIVIDEQGHHIQREYSDTLDKVLVQENVIETIEGQIENLTGECASCEKNALKRYIPIISPFTTAITIAAYYPWINTTDPLLQEKIDTIFGPMSKAMASYLPLPLLWIPAAGILEWHLYRIYRHVKNNIQGINCQLDFLRTALVEERKVLEELQQVKTRENESTEFRTVKVDDAERLENLQSWLDLYFDLGYHVKRYLRLYQQGRLDSNLERYYTATGIQAAKEFLEEKGPSLVYGKKNKDQS